MGTIILIDPIYNPEFNLFVHLTMPFNMSAFLTYFLLDKEC